MEARNRASDGEIDRRVIGYVAFYEDALTSVKLSHVFPWLIHSRPILGEDEGEAVVVNFDLIPGDMYRLIFLPGERSPWFAQVRLGVFQRPRKHPFLKV